MSKVLRGIKARDQTIKRLALVVMVTTRKLKTHFQGYRILVKTDYHVCQVLKKLDLARRMVFLVVKLSEYDTMYILKGNIKSRVLGNDVSPTWILYMDEASNIKGIGSKIILDEPNDLLIRKSLKFEFKASNNQTEYEALVTDMTLSLKVGVSTLRANNDSQLVAKQVSDGYQAKEPQHIM